MSERAAELKGAGIHSVEDLLYRVETLDRSNVWVYVACDRDPFGALVLVNATGFYPDEISAGLAGQTYVREWAESMPESEPPVTFPIPLFVESGAIPFIWPKEHKRG